MNKSRRRRHSLIICVVLGLALGSGCRAQGDRPWAPREGERSAAGQPGVVSQAEDSVAGSREPDRRGVIHADAPPTDGLGPIGQLGGSAAAVAVHADRAYMGVGRRLVVVDVAGEVTRELGQSPDLGDAVRAVALRDGVAWVAAGQAGLLALDVEHPSRIAILGRLETSWATFDVVLDPLAPRAYVAEGARGLRIVDTSDRAAPRQQARLDTPGEARAVVYAAGFAYVADWGVGVSVLDLRDLAAPRALAVYATGEASDIAWVGDPARPLLAVADRARGLLIVDAAQASAPTLLAEIALEGAAERVAVDGGADRAWVAARAGGLRVVDLTQPEAPREVASLQTSTIAWDVALAPSGQRAYVADVGAYTPSQPGIGGGSWEAGHIWGVEAQAPEATGFSGLRVVDWQAGGVLEEAAVHLSPGFVEAVVQVDGRLLLADGYAGLVWAEASDPERPSLLGHVSTAGAAHALTVVDDIAYVADGPAGVAAIDLGRLNDGSGDGRAPGSSAERWRLDTPGEALGIAHERGLLYVADGEAGLRVVDPTGPRELRSVSVPGYAWDLSVEDDMLWLAARNGGLRVLSLADPRAPREVAAVLADGAVVFQAVVLGDRAWVAAGPSGLVLLDVSRPSAPRELARLPLEGTAVGVAIDVPGARAYVAAGRGGLVAVDITTPTQPRIERAWALPGVAERVTLRQGIAYVATERGGLQLLRVRPSVSPSGEAALHLPRVIR